MAMNVLLATDGSVHAKVAEELVASIKWPEGSRISAIQVQEMMPGVRGLPDDVYATLFEETRRWIDEHLEELATALSRTDLNVDVRLMSGRPASEIVEEADRIHADLIVIGSRGRGAIVSTILGSVASEVIDHAACPVLVARVPRLTSVVVADDGSGPARHAEDVVAGWAFLQDLPMRVVSVADLAPYVGALEVGFAMMSADTYQQMIDEQRELHKGHARDAAARLGPNATFEVREGFVAQEIVAAAADAKADLIVVGSRGQTGLARLLVGSTARGVLFHAPVSVLVIRQKAGPGTPG